MKNQFLAIKNPGEFKDANTETAKTYEEIERRDLPLLEKIIDSFEQATKQQTGWTDQNRPKQSRVDDYKYGSIIIHVTTIPQQKKPSWKKVIEKTEYWTGFLQRDYANGIKRKGIITKNNRAYISLDMAIEEIKRNIQENTEGKEGISQKVEFEAPEQIAKEGIKQVIYSEGKNYAALTLENAADYVRASNLKKEIQKRFYGLFKNMLKQKTSTDETIEDTQKEYVRIGDCLFPIQIVPRDNISYADVGSNLIKENDSEKITKTTGELIRLQKGRGGKELEETYQLKIENGVIYIGLDALNSRIKELKEIHTKQSVNYNISHAIRLD